MRIRFESNGANTVVKADLNAPEVIRHPPGIQPHLMQNHSGETTIAGVEVEGANLHSSIVTTTKAEVIHVKDTVQKGLYRQQK